MGWILWKMTLPLDPVSSDICSLFEVVVAASSFLGAQISWSTCVNIEDCDVKARLVYASGLWIKYDYFVRPSSGCIQTTQSISREIQNALSQECHETAEFGFVKSS